MIRTPFRRDPTSSRGQGLVEFAIVLPLLALLMVMALDFGRVFFGWVALQNASRVAADYAAKNYDAWSAPDQPIKQLERDRYEALIDSDADAINCAMASIQSPDFTDAASGTAVDPPEAGDHATVRLDCQMTLLTPLANSVLGGGVNLSAESDFPVHRPETTRLPEADAPPPPPGCDTGEANAPDLVGMTMQTAWDTWDVNFDTANFSPTLVTTGPGNNKNKIVQSQIPTDGVCLSTTTGTMRVDIP